MKLRREAFRSVLGVVLAIVYLITPVVGQEKSIAVKVGDSNVSASFIKPGKSIWSVSSTTPAGKVIDQGTWNDELQVVQVGGRTAIKRVQEWKTPDGKTFQNMETIVDAKTFAPITSEFKRADGMFGRKEYDGAFLKDQYITPPSTELIRKEVKLEMPVFDFTGGMFGLLLAGFPLQEGYSASLPIDFQNKEGQILLKWLNFQVQGKEMTAGGQGKPVETFIVKTETENGKWSFLLNNKSAPYVFKVTFKGPAGNTRVWTLVRA